MINFSLDQISVILSNVLFFEQASPGNRKVLVHDVSWLLQYEIIKEKQSRDICGTGSLAPMEAVMTVCNLERFTCHSDGACIEMERR